MAFTRSATRGDWNSVSSGFDKRQGARAKAANEVEGEAEVEGPGLFDVGAAWGTWRRSSKDV